MKFAHFASRMYDGAAFAIVWVDLHSHFCNGLQNMDLFYNRVRTTVQGHPRSIILAPIESAYATSY